ncbi:hypothetical protein HOH87_03455 [bacterium]|nr:hypothetical protein [bacterium]
MAVILYVTLRFTKTIQRKRFSGEIRIIDRLPVDNHSTLLIIDVRGKEYFMSLSGKNIQLIEHL